MKDKRGSMIPLFGVSMVTIMVFSGMALDYSRLLNTKQRAQNSVDAAALYVASEISKLDEIVLSKLASGLASDIEEQLVAKASEYFHSNMQRADAVDVQINTSVYPITKRKFEISTLANGITNTTFMKLAKIEQMRWQTKAVSVVEIPAVELSVVADVSYSMSNSDIAAMKQSLTGLVDKLFKNGKTNDFYHVNLIPFADNVNFGMEYKAHWLHLDKAGQYAADSYEADFHGCFRPEFNPNARRIEFGYTVPGSYSAMKYSQTLYTPFCPADSSKAELFTSDPALLKSRISSLTKGYGTGTGIATMWGLRALDPDWRGKFLNETSLPRDFGSEDEKYMIILTDGRPIQFDPEGDGKSNGITDPAIRRVIAEESFNDACNAIKTKPGTINVYTIAYRISDSNVKIIDSLRSCTHGKGKFYRASQDNLDEVINAISGEISRVKLQS